MSTTPATPATQAPPDAVRKVTVNFAPEAYDTLATIARSRNISLSEALRQAISLMAFVVNETKAGSKILISRNGETRELQLL